MILEDQCHSRSSVQLVQKLFHLFWNNLKWQQISICECEKYLPFGLYTLQPSLNSGPSSIVYLLSLTKKSNVISIFISDVKLFSHLHTIFLSFQFLTKHKKWFQFKEPERSFFGQDSIRRRAAGKYEIPRQNMVIHLSRVVPNLRYLDSSATLSIQVQHCKYL